MTLKRFEVRQADRSGRPIELTTFHWKAYRIGAKAVKVKKSTKAKNVSLPAKNMAFRRKLLRRILRRG